MLQPAAGGGAAAVRRNDVVAGGVGGVGGVCGVRGVTGGVGGAIAQKLFGPPVTAARSEPDCPARPARGPPVLSSHRHAQHQQHHANNANGGGNAGTGGSKNTILYGKNTFFWGIKS